MRLTEKRLRKVIREEIQRLNEGGLHYEFLEFCRGLTKQDDRIAYDEDFVERDGAFSIGLHYKSRPRKGMTIYAELFNKDDVYFSITANGRTVYKYEGPYIRNKIWNPLVDEVNKFFYGGDYRYIG